MKTTIEKTIELSIDDLKAMLSIPEVTESFECTIHNNSCGCNVKKYEFDDYDFIKINFKFEKLNK